MCEQCEEKQRIIDGKKREIEELERELERRLSAKRAAARQRANDRENEPNGRGTEEAR
jgi:hypothetical protein